MKIPPAQDIWVDLFELTRFRGKRRRLYGPAQFRSVRSRSAEWGVSIDSIVIGPGAHLWLFRSGDTAGGGTWLLPGQAVEDAEKLVDDGIDSFAILTGPPEAQGPGYAVYQEACRKQESAGRRPGWVDQTPGMGDSIDGYP